MTFSHDNHDGGNRTSRQRWLRESDSPFDSDRIPESLEYQGHGWQASVRPRVSFWSFLGLDDDRTVAIATEAALGSLPDNLDAPDYVQGRLRLDRGYGVQADYQRDFKIGDGYTGYVRPVVGLSTSSGSFTLDTSPVQSAAMRAISDQTMTQLGRELNSAGVYLNREQLGELTRGVVSNPQQADELITQRVTEAFAPQLASLQEDRQRIQGLLGDPRFAGSPQAAELRQKLGEISQGIASIQNIPEQVADIDFSALTRQLNRVGQLERAAAPRYVDVYQAELGAYAGLKRPFQLENGDRISPYAEAGLVGHIWGADIRGSDGRRDVLGGYGAEARVGVGISYERGDNFEVSGGVEVREPLFDHGLGGTRAESRDTSIVAQIRAIFRF